MTGNRYRVLYWAGSVIAVNWLSLAVVNPEIGGTARTIAVGYFFGSLFAQTTLAAGWCAFGPGWLVWRLPLSLVWIASLAVAIAINVIANDGPQDGPILLGACLFSQWLVLQIPLWGFAFGFGLQLRHTEDLQRSADLRARQFGIRQLILVTTIVAVILGLGRVAVTAIGEQLNFIRGEGLILLFLAGAATLLSLPVLLGTLMRRMVIPGILMAMAFIVAATYFELPLLMAIEPSFAAPSEALISINLVTAGIIQIVAALVRLNGYTLAVSNGRAES